MDDLLPEPDKTGRQFYRLDYPRGERPVFRSETAEFPVADVSERGMGIAVTHEQLREFMLGSPVAGEIEFHDSDPFEVKGTVVRLREGFVGVLLNETPIPWGTILREQHYLLSKYRQRL